MSDTLDELRRIAIHESGHVLASWYFTGQILSVTLGSDLALSGAVCSGCYNSNTLVGERQHAIGIAAGAAAEGVEVAGDDARKLQEAARRIVGMAANPEAIADEVARATVRARWLVQEYASEIRAVAERLVEFHELLANMERRYADIA
jgi:hypothetical protein